MGGGIVTVQNLTEFYVVVTEKVEHPLPSVKARAIIEDTIASDKWRIFDRDVFTISRAILLSSKYKIHFWDALLAQVMLENGITGILTENSRDFRKIPGITAENPFK